MVDHNEKVLQIKKYLTDVINDTMLTEARKGYIRITKPGADQYAHISLIIGKFYYLDILQKIYFYFAFDKNIRWGHSDDVMKYYKKVLEYVCTDCRHDINCTMSILGPTYLCDDNLISPRGSNISRIITPYTIGYWKGVNEQYEFLNDPAIAKMDKYKYDIENGITDFTQRSYLERLNNLRKRLNKDNDCIHNPNLIPSVFTEYKTEYKNIMGIDLPQYDFENDSNIIELVNATDFFNDIHY